MPTPIGHSAAGLIVFVLKNRTGRWKELIQGLRQALCLVLLANLPDIDFINPYTGKIEIEGEFHHQEVHSLGFALAVSFLILLIGRWRKRRWGWAWASWSFLALGSHVLLDYLFSNPAPGMPIFFPFSTKRFTSPLELSYELDETHLFGRLNWLKLFGEGSLSLLVLASAIGCFALRNRSKR